MHQIYDAHFTKRLDDNEEITEDIIKQLTDKISSMLEKITEISTLEAVRKFLNLEKPLFTCYKSINIRKLPDTPDLTAKLGKKAAESRPVTPAYREGERVYRHLASSPA